MTTYANVGHILLKRGNTTQSQGYTGPLGELTFDTDLNTVRVHNGSTPGGVNTLATVAQLPSYLSTYTGNIQTAQLNFTNNSSIMSTAGQIHFSANTQNDSTGFYLNNTSSGVFYANTDIQLAAGQGPSYSSPSWVFDRRGNLTLAGNVIFADTTVQTTAFNGYGGLANLTQTQVDAISGPLNGWMVYNYTYGNVQVYTTRLAKWGNITLS